MRTATEIIDDLANLSSIEWNEELASEYNKPLAEFYEMVSNYNYRITSEDNIHHKIRSIFDNLLDKQEDGVENTNISSYMRELGSLEFEPGDIFDRLIFCGFVFNDSLLINTLIKTCNYYNCIAQGSNFSGSKLIQTMFIDCDFAEAEFSEASIIKCAFYDCNFRKSRFISSDIYDSVFYNCDFSETDADASHYTSTFLHNCNFSNTSLKVSRFLSCSISFCDFSNSLMRDSSFFDCNLIDVNFKTSNLKGLEVIGTPCNNVNIDTMYNEIFGISISEEDDEPDFYEDEDED